MADINIRKGRQVTLGYARESTRLTGMTTIGTSIPWTDFSSTVAVEKIDDNSGVGNLEPHINSHKRLEAIEGSMGGFLNANTIGLPLFHVYGSVASVQTLSTGAFTHTFSLANTVLNPTFSLFYNLEQSFRARGCQIKSLKIDVAEGGEAKYTTDFMGIEESVITAPAYTQPDVSNILTGANMSFKMASNVAGLAVAPEIKIKNVSISIDRGTAYDTSYNNGFNNDVLQNGFTTEVTATLMMRLDDFDTLFKNAGERAVSVKFGGQNLPVIGTSALKPSIEFVIARTLVHGYTRSISLDDYLMFDVTFKPMFSASDNFSLRTILINGLATI